MTSLENQKISLSFSFTATIQYTYLSRLATSIANCFPLLNEEMNEDKNKRIVFNDGDTIQSLTIVYAF